MLDPNRLRRDLDTTAERLALRGFTLDKARFHSLEEERKQVQVRTEELQAQRNARSKAIGQAKAAGEDIAPLLAEVSKLGEDLKTSETRLSEVQIALQAFALEIPNLTHDDVPVGLTEEEGREERRWGEPPSFDFETKDHVELGAGLAAMDFEMAGKLAGSRFVTLSGPLARLHRALGQFMLELHTSEHGYTEMNVPVLVNAETLTGTGQLPKFADDQFYVEKQGYYLIPTAEVPLTNLARDRIIPDPRVAAQVRCAHPVLS